MTAAPTSRVSAASSGESAGGPLLLLLLLPFVLLPATPALQHQRMWHKTVGMLSMSAGCKGTVGY
jgi:hypothetical protein